MIGGVLGGIAEYYDLEPSLVRIGYTVATFLTGFAPGVLLYIAMIVIIPNAPEAED